MSMSRRLPAGGPKEPSVTDLENAVKRHLKIFLGGALVVVPFAITLYVVWWLAASLANLGTGMLNNVGILKYLEAWKALGIKVDHTTFPAKVIEVGLYAKVLGAIIVIVGIYFLGMATHLWIFRRTLTVIEKWISRVPGVKTIYESVRDLMKLFGGDSARMGRAVLLNVPDSDVSVLGILTNENPAGVSDAGHKKVAVYLPFSYMFGGLTVYVPHERVQEANMSVDQALKLCATAHVGAEVAADVMPGLPAAQAVVAPMAGTQKTVD